MDCFTLVLLAGLTVTASAWSAPFYPVHRAPPLRVVRFAPLPPRHRLPIRPEPLIKREKFQEKPKPERPKRDYDYDHDHDHNDHDHSDKPRGTSGVTGPVHTFVKTDKNANYKWGVRHHVGKKYAS